jgi:hypothetical protein
MTELRLPGPYPPLLVFLVITALAAVAWWLYWRESHSCTAPYRWLLPTLRAAAIAMALAMLLEPSLRTRFYEGDPSQLHIWIDGSSSMQQTDQDERLGGAIPPPTRYQRAIDRIAGGDVPKLEQWSNQGDVLVHRFDTDQPTLLWRSTLQDKDNPAKPDSTWNPNPWGQATSLGSPLLAARSRWPSDPVAQEKTVRQPLLLITDGQHNFGPSPVDLAAQWRSDLSPVWILGMGTARPPKTLALLSVESPRQIDRNDRLQGTLQLVDRLDPGQSFQLQVVDGQEVLWTQTLASDGSGLREIPFSIATDALVEGRLAAADDNLQLQRLAVSLRAQIVQGGSVSEDPAKQKRWTIGIETRERRVLLLDSRSRWETRYLRNALERDPQWEVDSFLMLAGETPVWYSQVAEPKPFPVDQDAWNSYDLVITGELDPGAISSEGVDQLREAIERGGTGWIAIDGQRQHLRSPRLALLQPLLPVTWLSEPFADMPQPWKVQPTTAGQALAALQLADGSQEANLERWQQLPGLMHPIAAQAAPGSEVLLELQREETTAPLMSTRLAGAGRVVHLASDESWRWRYEVADEIHQRFWNQVARWAMRLPFAVQSQYASLDTGPVVIDGGRAVPVRALVKDSAGQPAQLDSLQAIARLDGQSIATTTLLADPDYPGLYRGSFDNLPQGSFTIGIEAPGFSQEALQVTSTVDVVVPPTEESLRLDRNDSLLSQLAEATGGLYVPEEQAERLWERMELESSSRLVENDRQLWQSYWWFVPLIALLAAEWWFRKKAGLI